MKNVQEALASGEAGVRRGQSKVRLRLQQHYLVEFLLVSKHGPDLLPLIFDVFLKGAELLLHDAVLPLEPQP